MILQKSAMDFHGIYARGSNLSLLVLQLNLSLHLSIFKINYFLSVMPIGYTVINNSDFLKRVDDKISSKSLHILFGLLYQLLFFSHKDQTLTPLILNKAL